MKLSDTIHDLIFEITRTTLLAAFIHTLHDLPFKMISFFMR